MKISSKIFVTKYSKYVNDNKKIKDKKQNGKRKQNTVQ